MKVKTLTGPSIQAALAEARRLLGEDVVLLESVPPSGDLPARVTVMTDVPSSLPKPAVRHTPLLAPSRTAPALAGAPAGESTEALTRLRHVAVAEEASVAGAGVSVARGGYSGVGSIAFHGKEPSSVPAYREGFTYRPQGVEPRRRGSLFSSEPLALPPAPVGPTADAITERMDAQFKMLTDRLKQLESALGDTVIGASMQWAAHPLFALLLRKGMRPTSAAKLFDRLATRGYTPDADEEKLRWALAQEVKSSLDIAAPRHDSPNVLLIGPSGAGKTSLALKLAKHPHFYGRRRTTVIFVLPEDSQTLGYYTPVELYRHFEIPVQTVRSAEEMQQALDRVQGFEQIVIDTAPLPSQEAAARRMLTHIRRVTGSVMPLEVQLVVNATRVLDKLTPAFFTGLPLRPDSVTLTHLDEIDGWGRIAEWLIGAGLPVRTLSTGPRVPDGIASFSPSWFVEEMLQR